MRVKKEVKTMDPTAAFCLFKRTLPIKYKLSFTCRNRKQIKIKDDSKSKRHTNRHGPRPIANLCSFPTTLLFHYRLLLI